MAGKFTFASLTELMVRNDVAWFCSKVLGIQYSQLKPLIYPRPRYRHFNVNKRSGGVRSIAEPTKPLKDVQEQILEYLEQRRGSYNPAVHGFVPRRSIVTNAREHCSPKIHQILNLDLEDFFPSISFYRVRGVLRKHPFDCSHAVATVIAQICTIDGFLPQGAPTSPLLSNLVCRTLDRDLLALARRNRARYTRYADDITFSFARRTPTGLSAAICSVSDDSRVTIGAELYDLITSKHHFRINSSKTRLSNRGRRMEVTGLTINQHLNVRRIFIDRIRGALNAWENYGYAAAEAEWQNRVKSAKTGEYEKKPWKRQTRLGVPPKLKNVLWGKLLFVRMVRGNDDLLYNRLAERYNAAVEKERTAGQFTAPLLPVVPVVRDHKSAMDAVFVLEWAADYRINATKIEMVGAEGTAFAYRQENFLITCDHVLDLDVQVDTAVFHTTVDAPEIENLDLHVTRPHTRESWPVKVLYRNKQFDFAILRFEGEVPSHRFYAAVEAPIQARDKGILIGFPAYKNWNLPDFNEQTVLNRTEPHRGMRSFSITGAGSIRPGNSGGPFTDLRFRVAGMAQRGAYAGQGHDECLCFEIIDDLIESWRAKSAPAVATFAAPVPNIPTVATSEAATPTSAAGESPSN